MATEAQFCNFLLVLWRGSAAAAEDVSMTNIKTPVKADEQFYSWSFFVFVFIINNRTQNISDCLYECSIIINTG